jgi:large subunit ribosomal protein L9
MKVVLSKDVKDLGSAGQVKEVSDGYARNFLFPRKLAIPATTSALQQVQDREKSDQRRHAAKEKLAQEVAERLKQKPLKIYPKVGEQGRLYGSVTAADIAEALSKELGQDVDKRKIELADPIRVLGEYQVPYRISRSVTAMLTVQVERGPAPSRG